LSSEDASVIGPDGGGILVAPPGEAPPVEPAEVRPAGPGLCTLYRVDPYLQPHSSGPDSIHFHGIVTCPSSYLSASVAVYGYRNSANVAFKYDADFAPDIAASALAGYYCNGNDASNFYHRDYAYSNDSAGNSYAASGNSITIYRHCG
jgi:hypothetical protein